MGNRIGRKCNHGLCGCTSWFTRCTIYVRDGSITVIIECRYDTIIQLEAVLLIATYVDDLLDLLSRCLAACEMYDKVMKQLATDGIQIKEKRLDT